MTAWGGRWSASRRPVWRRSQGRQLTQMLVSGGGKTSTRAVQTTAGGARGSDVLAVARKRVVRPASHTTQISATVDSRGRVRRKRPLRAAHQGVRLGAGALAPALRLRRRAEVSTPSRSAVGRTRIPTYPKPHARITRVRGPHELRHSGRTRV